MTIYLLVAGVIGSIQLFTPTNIITDGRPANATVSVNLLAYNWPFASIGWTSLLRWVC